MNHSFSEFIYKGPYSQCLLFTMKKDEFLKSHRATVDVMIIVKQGTMKITEDDKETILYEGENLLLKANIKHAGFAITNIEFYLFKLAPHEVKKDIQNRNDIGLLVRTFYNKAREDNLLSPVFNKKISTEDQWEQHFIKMTDFWETVLFATQAYRGNPFPMHFNIGITPDHFERWVSLFHQTVNEHFSGIKAEEVKERIEKMRRLFETKLFLTAESRIKPLL